MTEDYAMTRLAELAFVADPTDAERHAARVRLQTAMTEQPSRSVSSRLAQSRPVALAAGVAAVAALAVVLTIAQFAQPSPVVAALTEFAEAVEAVAVPTPTTSNAVYIRSDQSSIDITEVPGFGLAAVRIVSEREVWLFADGSWRFRTSLLEPPTVLDPAAAEAFAAANMADTVFLEQDTVFPDRQGIDLSSFVDDAALEAVILETASARGIEDGLRNRPVEIEAIDLLVNLLTEPDAPAEHRAAAVRVLASFADSIDAADLAADTLSIRYGWTTRDRVQFDEVVTIDLASASVRSRSTTLTTGDDVVGVPPDTVLHSAFYDAPTLTEAG